MKKEPETQKKENAERASESSSNFLGEIPEAWKRRARAAFGYAFCVTLLIVVLSEIAAGLFPEVRWFTVASVVLRHIGVQMYHYSLGLGTAIIAYCLAWENIMYLREKRRREKAEALAAAVNAELQRAREEAEAINAQLLERVSTLENELRAREQAAAINAQLLEQINALETEVTQLRRELNRSNARSQSADDAEG